MKQKFSVSLTLALIMAMLVTSLALADNVQNDVTVGGSDTFTLGSSTNVSYRITANNGDGQTGCNADDGSPASVTINVPAGVTATPNPVIFTTCSTNAPVTFTATIAGNFEITVSVSDSGAGTYNTNPAKFTLHVLAPSDSTPPVITPSVVGSLGNNGWYTSDVMVTWSVVDNESAISSSIGCGPTTIDSDTAGTTLTCSATSAGGTSNQSVTIKRDATAPTISGSALPAPNGAGWNNTDVSVSFSCSDALSGIASCGPNQILNTDGAGQSESGTAVDNAGNSTSTTVSGINIDKTAPTVSANPAPSANANGWNNSDVTVSFSGSDALSGIASCDTAVVLSSEGAGQSASGTCTDVSGNVSAPAIASGIKIDKTVPTISASITPDRPGTGWWNIASGAPSVSFTCDDSLSGVDGGCPAPHAFGEGADQTYSQTIYDLAGNSASTGVSDVDVDLTGPVVTASHIPAANAFGWNNTDVTVTFSGTDSLSGLGSCLSADFTFEGANQFVTGTCYDEAGNAGNYVTVADINIDKTLPSVSLVGGPVDGGIYYFGYVPVAPTCSASDALSGLDGSCIVAGYNNAIGTHTVSASATDKAGNPASASITYEVRAWTLDGFYKPVDMGGLIPVWNTVKGGSTVPLKFEVFAGSTELTDISAIKSLIAVQVACTLGWEDTIETLSPTGGTSLRYDWTDGQFIYNWQTLKKPGNCYKVTMTAQDGSSLSALFKLK